MEARLRLTSRCNLNCEYCFAKEFKRKNSGDISLQNLERIIKKLKESGIKTLKIQGGEPTYHSNFIEVSQYLKNAGMTLHLYTNGIFESSIIKCIYENYKSVIVNCNQLMEADLKILSNNIEALIEAGCSVMLGKTISRKTSDIDGFLRFAETFRENVKIRFDASRPHMYSAEAYKVFKEDAHSVIDALIKAQLQKFELEIDCCYPPCFFSKSEWRLIRRHLRGFWSKCTTIVDISPDLALTTCFCGVQFVDLEIDDFNSLREASLFAEYIENRMRFEVSSDERCNTCLQRFDKICQGGCLGHKNTPLRYPDKRSLNIFRGYLNYLCNSDYKTIMSSVFSPMTKCYLLSECGIATDKLEEFYEQEITKEPENPFLYTYLANSVYITGRYSLVRRILNEMPTTDPEANLIKENILLKIGEQ